MIIILQSWNTGANPQLPAAAAPQMANRPQFPPPNFSGDPNAVQGVNFRYSTPNGSVAPAILGGNIMVHPNASPVPVNNLPQQQQQQQQNVMCGQPMMNLQPGNPQHNPVMEHANNSTNPHQCGIVTTGNTAVLPGSVNPMMSNNAGNQVVMNPAMMVHNAGNSAIMCPAQQRVAAEEVQSVNTGIMSNNKILQQNQQQQQQHPDDYD